MQLFVYFSLIYITSLIYAEGGGKISVGIQAGNQ